MKLTLMLLACVISIHCISQIEASNKTINPEKWTIKANKLKASTGRLLIANSPGTVWTIYVYSMIDNKYVNSFAHTNNKGIINLAPGEYKITLNLSPVENVVIKKGHDTKLKTGILDVPHKEVWYLYDETGKSYYSSGIKPEKLLLPVGNYQLKSGETENHVIVEEEINLTEQKAFYESKYWVMTPLEAMTAGIGKLSINIPEDTTAYIPLIDKTITIEFNIRDTIRIREDNSYTVVNMPKYLTTGQYYYISLNSFKFTVPIESGKETRIKTGFLIITKKETEGFNSSYNWMSDVYDHAFGSDDALDITWAWSFYASGSGNPRLTGKGGAIFALPPGDVIIGKYDLKL